MLSSQFANYIKLLSEDGSLSPEAMAIYSPHLRVGAVGEDCLFLLFKDNSVFLSIPNLPVFAEDSLAKILLFCKDFPQANPIVGDVLSLLLEQIDASLSVQG